MKQANGKNQKGTVLLAVVCMGMIMMTFATICLNLVRYTNAATARNVMRTQAKVTAEAVLTEFVGQYTGTDANGNPNYERIVTLAGSHSEAAPLEIKVNPSDSDFKTDYGETKLQIFKDSSGYRVRSICEFGGDGYIRPQEQTASITFAYASASPMVPSNALEASEGVDASTEKGCPIDGDIYIEKSMASEPDRIVNIGAQDVTYNAHLYSEFSIMFSNQVNFKDVVNKTGTLEYEPNRNTGDGNYFVQAPTIWTEGYLVGRNNFQISTTVGKVDENRYNGCTAPRVGKTYPTSSKMENMDGFVYVGKQLMLLGSTAGGFKIGDATNPIDTYCGGIYMGSVNSAVSEYDKTTSSWKANQVNGQYTAADSVKDSSGGSALNGNGDATDITINGNVYCYDNGETPTNNYNKSGSLYILAINNKCMTINGSCFIENNLILQKGARLKVTGDLHVGGSIYVVDMSGGVMKVNPDNSASIVSGTIVSGPDAQVGYKADSFITVGGIASKAVDINGVDDPRNEKPQPGYNASTGSDTPVRTNLKDTYKNAGTDMIFEASLDPGHKYNGSAKNIAQKYAEAMATPLSTKKYIDSSNKVVDLVEKHGSGSDTVREIKSSCRFSTSDYGTGTNLNELYVYSVKLTDEDIVIALPLNSNITPLIRVDSTERDEVKAPFVYFMYYSSDPSDLQVAANNVTINNCLYLSTAAAFTSKTVTVYNVYDNASNSFVDKNVTFKASDSVYRNTKKINYEPGGKNICYIADITMYTPYDMNEVINLDQFCSYARGKLDDKTVEDNTEEGFQNYIIYFVPDDVSFYLGDNGQLQGIIYAPGSYVEFGGSGTRVFGQVKCKKFKFGAENKNKVIYNIPAPDGSILDYVAASLSVSTNVEMQFYEY